MFGHLNIGLNRDSNIQSICTLALLLSFVSISQARAERFTPTQFRAWFLEGGHPTMSQQDAERARHVQYVFVAGLYNEKSETYFLENKRHLMALGVPESSIHIVRTESDKDDEENVELVGAALKKIAHDSGEPLEIFAHSRGTRIVAGVMADDFNFFDRSVKDVFLSNPALGPNSLVDYIETGHPRPGESPKARLFDAPLFAIVGWKHRRDHAEHQKGRAGMTKENTEAFWNNHSPEKSLWAAYRKKIHVIEAEAEPNQLPFEARVAHHFISLFEGAGDGLVSRTTQLFLPWARPLLKISAGHTDLVEGPPKVGEEKLNWGRAITGALFASAGRPDGETPDEPEASVSRAEMVELSKGPCLFGLSEVQRHNILIRE